MSEKQNTPRPDPGATQDSYGQGEVRDLDDRDRLAGYALTGAQAQRIWDDQHAPAAARVLPTWVGWWWVRSGSERVLDGWEPVWVYYVEPDALGFDCEVRGVPVGSYSWLGPLALSAAVEVLAETLVDRDRLAAVVAGHPAALNAAYNDGLREGAGGHDSLGADS